MKSFLAISAVMATALFQASTAFPAPQPATFTCDCIRLTLNGWESCCGGPGPVVITTLPTYSPTSSKTTKTPKPTVITTLPTYSPTTSKTTKAPVPTVHCDCILETPEGPKSCCGAPTVITTLPPISSTKTKTKSKTSTTTPTATVTKGPGPICDCIIETPEGPKSCCPVPSGSVSVTFTFPTPRIPIPVTTVSGSVVVVRPTSA